MWPGDSLRTPEKIVSGAGIELKARKASSASRSTWRSKPGTLISAFSSDPKESVGPAIR